MKRNILNNTYWIAALILLFLAACSNETETPEVELPKTYNIRVSVRSGNELTRATSDLIEQEKIRRYDIFIYEPGDGGALVKYIGSKSSSGLNEISENFPSSIDFTTPKDIYVVVNNPAWDEKDETYMKNITKSSLKDTVFTCVQHADYDSAKPDSITAFNGYKKDENNNEPFVMSTFVTNYNFSSTGQSTLNLLLKRTYAKVILKFKTSLDATEDADWIGLKELSINRICNIADTTSLFMENGAGYKLKRKKNYNYVKGREYKLTGMNVNISGGNTFPFDTFAADCLALRLFPHDPSEDVDNQATCLYVDFAVGPVGKDNVITKRFQRRINIGDENKNFQIDPNYAYIITISYGKTTNSITTNCRVVPWNLLYVENEVEPDF